LEGIQQIDEISRKRSLLDLVELLGKGSSAAVVVAAAVVEREVELVEFVERGKEESLERTESPKLKQDGERGREPSSVREEKGHCCAEFESFVDWVQLKKVRCRFRSIFACSG